MDQGIHSGSTSDKCWQYLVFTRSRDFSDFATTDERGTSLEQLHNSVHWDGACGSQFLTSDFSAFDPLL